MGHLPSFFVPARGYLAAQVQKKKNANYPEGGMGAPGID